MVWVTRLRTSSAVARVAVAMPPNLGPSRCVADRVSVVLLGLVRWSGVISRPTIAREATTRWARSSAAMRGFSRICGAAGAGEVLRGYQPSHGCAGSDKAAGAIE